MSGPDILDFVDDARLLGNHFRGRSWDRHRAVLKAAFALPLNRHDQRLFSEVSGGRAPPTRQVKEIVYCVGRSGGKDSVAAALAVYIATTADLSHLRPGERGSVLLLAVDRDQAAIAYRYCVGYFEESPALRAMVKRFSDKNKIIELTNGAEIAVGTNSMRSVRGRTYIAAIYDECAFWRDENAANPDIEVDTAVSPGLMRFPGSLKVMISSVHRRDGLLFTRYAQSFGKPDNDVLVVLGTSMQFNPTLDTVEIDRQLAADVERASAEYLSKWRDDLSNFLDRQLVEQAIDKDILLRKPQTGIRYIAFCDPSGGRGDSFTCGIAHRTIEGDIVLDNLFERRAPFDPSSVIAEISALLKYYRLNECHGDAYGAEFVVEHFRSSHIRYTQSERAKNEIYLDALPLFTSGQAKLLHNERLVHQLISLERRTNRGGRDSVNHPQGGHDDGANACCGALVLAADTKNTQIIIPDKAKQWAQTPRIRGGGGGTSHHPFMSSFPR